jgi:hypothetical protein
LTAAVAKLLHDKNLEQKELSAVNSSVIRAYTASLPRVADYKFRVRLRRELIQRSHRRLPKAEQRGGDRFRIA